MMTLAILPIIAVLACILVFRTRGIDRVLSLVIAILSGLFSVWYFGFLAL